MDLMGPKADTEKRLQMQEEFDNFMMKVTEVGNIVHGLSSSDKDTAERAKALADSFLDGKSPRDSRSSGMYSGFNRTVVNQKAFDRMGSDGGDPQDMSKEMFMAGIEKDAEARAKDRRERKRMADTLKTRGNDAFRRGDFLDALVFFDQAISHVKDSVVLYENRALTCLHLYFYTRVIEDCDWALRLDENTLKALLYKARAYHCLSDHEKSEQCIEEALNKHVKHKDIILRYKESWNKKNDVGKMNLAIRN